MSATRQRWSGPDRRGPDVPAARWTSRLWLWYVAAGVLAIGVFELSDQSTRDWLYIVLGLVGAIGILVGVRVNRPVLWLPWCLMAAGQLIWVTGDSIYTWYERFGAGAPFPSVADVFYLSAYPFLALGIAMLIWGRRPRRDVAAVLDSLTVTAGVGMLSWVVLAGPTIAQSQHAPVAAAFGVAYPVGDILLVAGLAMLLATPGGRSSSMRFLLLAIALLIIADSAYMALGLFGSGETYYIDFIWLGSYLFWGAAALHPSMAPFSQPNEEVDVRMRLARLVAMAAAVLIAPMTLAAQRLAGVDLDVWAVIIGSVLMSLLVLTRMKMGIDQITRAHAQLEALRDELAFQAAHDSLTLLPNRAQAMTLIRGALNRAQRSGDLVALLFIDLDGFKGVNDTYGHRAGDQVLCEVSRRLTAGLRAGDVAARLGGDEFVVLLDPIDVEESALRVAERLIASVSAPILIEGGEALIGASIGVAYNQDGSLDAEALMHEADVAVYRAKAHGRGRVEVFSTELGAELQHRSEREAALVRAIEYDELVLHYQPIIELRSGRIEGYEALVRWEPPGERMVLPDEFIPLAEGSDLICDVDSWVLDRAAAQLAEWNVLLGTSDLMVSVNVSGRHVNATRIREDVRAALDRHDIKPSQLVLELTETILVHDALALDNLHELRRMGVTLSLDDFGTGYSSISQLSRLPIDIVKIDRSYVDTATPATRKLLDLMVHVIRGLGLRVVAEGVEREEQLDHLSALAVESVQGFLLGRPVPAREVYATLAQGPNALLPARTPN